MQKRIATAAVLAAAVFVTAPRSSTSVPQVQALPAQQVAAEIMLPPVMETEKPATLAVLDRDGRLVPLVSLKLPEGRQITTDSTGRARFVVSAAPGPYTVECVNSTAGTVVQATSTVIAHPSVPDGVSSTELVVASISRFVATTGHIVVHGSGFRGDADVNHVTFAARPALVLASSPESLVFQPGPAAVPGRSTAVIEIAGHSSKPLDVTLVAVDILRPAKGLVVGKKAALTVTITGTVERVPLAVENLFPGNIALTNGNFQRLMSGGGQPNTASIQFRSVHEGDFSVSVRVMSAVPDANTFASARRELIAASGVAKGDWARAVDRLVNRFDDTHANGHDAERLQGDIEKILNENPPAELQKQLRAAWLDFVRD